MRGTYELIQSLGSTETSRSHANDEDINITKETKVSELVFSKASEALQLVPSREGEG